MRAKKFRSNVAAVIIHPTENKVLMFRRLAEKDKNSGFFVGGGQLKWNWQFPQGGVCLLYTSPSPRDATLSR